MPRLITSARILFVSLVPDRKNRLPVFFQHQEIFELKTLMLKSRPRLLKVVIFSPEPDPSIGYYLDETFLEKTAHAYLRDGAKLEFRCNGQELTRDRAAVVESFMIQPGDRRFLDLKDYTNRYVESENAWALFIELFDSRLQNLFFGPQSWSGISVFAEAVSEPASERISLTSSVPDAAEPVLSRGD